MDSQVNGSFQLEFNLRFVWPPTCIDLRELVMTFVDFGQAQAHLQVDVHFSPFGHQMQVDTN